MPRHGHSRHPLYIVHGNMMRRCYNPKNDWFHNYGGRGITVCDRWHSFVSFYADNIGAYAPGLTLDRTDNNGSYSPANCRWITRAAQARNRRTNIWIEYQGVSRPLFEWADLIGISNRTLWMRIVERGWSLERAMTQPLTHVMGNDRVKKKAA